MPDVYGGAPVTPSRGAIGSPAGYGSLPRPLTSFIGRERELALAKRLLQGSFLVTLTGPGGSGKTRLCIALAAEYPDGVFFVPLAPVRDPELVTFHGQPYPQDWLLAEVLLDCGLDEDAMHAFFRANGLPVIFFPMRGHRWRVTVPFAGTRPEGPPSLAEIQELTSQRAPWPVTVSDPTWLASFRCHRRSASAYRRGRVLLAGDAVHIHSPAGGQGLNTGMLDAHNLGWKLALVAAGRAPDALLDTYGAERRPVADKVVRLTHTLVRYGTLTNPVKRKVRDVVVPALGRTAVMQRRAARRISQVYVAYPPGPLARPDRLRRPGPRPGQRMPDIAVRAGGEATTLHGILRGGRHVLVLPTAGAARLLDDPGLRPFRADFDAVAAEDGQKHSILYDGSGPVVLVRPDGYVAARGWPASLHTVTAYLRDLLRSPAGRPSEAAVRG